MTPNPLLIALALISFPAFAGDRDYAKEEDACLKSLIDYPGSPTALLTGGMVDGFYYDIRITRHPERDEDDATLRKEAERLKKQLEEIEGKIGK